ncbi:MAG: bifunctional precorrin-2 dehydrogenase/sirohydrochlorin ferrochelatase [Clostridia bacterium]|nr:bifunctional precorrin-2 dehydrogenase/sirohydrochlorin ferrochelatase [Clostridia bacterium]
MVLFPFYQNIEDKTFLVIGGGRIAKEKLEKLRLFTDNIVVVARETDLTLLNGLAEGITDLLVRPFEDADLELGDYVIGATDDRELNRHISALCQEQKKPVNIVDDPELCTFIFPSLVKRGDLVVGITTGGKSPAFGQRVRKFLEAELPEDTEAIIDELYALKLQLKETVPDQRERARQLKAYLNERLNDDTPPEEDTL